MEGCIREIEILVFNVMGIRLAVETSQVSGIMDLEHTVDRDVPVFGIPDLLKINFGHVSYKSPKVLLVKCDSSIIGIVVDRLEKVEALGLERIHPMPVLIEKCNGAKAIWGSVVDGDEVLLLIDFYKLPCCSPSAESGAEISA